MSRENRQITGRLLILTENLNRPPSQQWLDQADNHARVAIRKKAENSLYLMNPFRRLTINVLLTRSVEIKSYHHYSTTSPEDMSCGCVP